MWLVAQDGPMLYGQVKITVALVVPRVPVRVPATVTFPSRERSLWMSTGTVEPLIGFASLAPVILAMMVSPAWTFQNWELRMPPVQDLLPMGLARAPAPVAARADETRPAVASSARAPRT